MNWDLADLLAATGNPQWNPQLFVQFERLCTDHGIFEPMLANLLLERSYPAEDVLNASTQLDQNIREVAMIFSGVPSAGLANYSPGLTAREPVTPTDDYCMDRHGMAVILSLIDRPWAAQELITAFREIWEERQIQRDRAVSSGVA